MSEVIKEGWISKKGAVVRAWRKRWLVLIGKELIYSKKPGLNPQGVIKVDEIESMEKAREASRDHVFQLKMRAGRVFSIQAESENDVADWLTAIRKSMSPGEHATSNIDNYVPLHVFQHAETFNTFVARSKHDDALYFVDKYPLEFFENAEIVSNVDSKFISKTTATFVDQKCVLAVSEFVFARPLEDLLRSRVRFPIPTVQVYASEILLALNDIHRAGLVYGNLELSHLMVTENGHIRLRLLPSKLNLKRPGVNRGFCSPEVIQHQKLTPISDFWSLGVIIYTLLTGFTPFFRDSETKMAQVITQGSPRMSSDLSEAAADLISMLFRKGSGDITFGTVKGHRFFDGINWDKVGEMDMTDVDKFWRPKIDVTPQSFTMDDKKPMFTMEDIKQWSAF